MSQLENSAPGHPAAAGARPEQPLPRQVGHPRVAAGGGRGLRHHRGLTPSLCKTWASHLKCFHADVTLHCNIDNDNNFDLSDGVNDVYILPLNISKMIGSRKMNCTSIGEILSE